MKADIIWVIVPSAVAAFLFIALVGLATLYAVMKSIKDRTEKNAEESLERLEMRMERDHVCVNNGCEYDPEELDDVTKMYMIAVSYSECYHDLAKRFNEEHERLEALERKKRRADTYKLIADEIMGVNVASTPVEKDELKKSEAVPEENGAIEEKSSDTDKVGELDGVEAARYDEGLVNDLENSLKNERDRNAELEDSLIAEKKQCESLNKALDSERNNNRELAKALTAEQENGKKLSDNVNKLNKDLAVAREEISRLKSLLIETAKSNENKDNSREKEFADKLNTLNGRIKELEELCENCYKQKAVLTDAIEAVTDKLIGARGSDSVGYLTDVITEALAILNDSMK